jgi:DNA-binding CsgD family transcriptional regulator
MPSPQVSSGPEVAKTTEVLDAVELHGRGLLNARAGEIEAALGYLARAAAAAEGELTDLQRVTLLSTTVECRLARGEIAEARSVGDRLGVYLEQPGLAGATAHYGRGELCAAVNEVDLAAAHFARIPRLLGPADDDPDVIPWRTAAAVAAVRLGHRVEATALAREHLTLAGAAGAAYPIALGLRTLATVDARTDRASLLRQALAELDGVPSARLEAQIQTDLAGLLMLAGGPRDAPEGLALLRAAEAYAGHEDLWPLLGRVRRLLTRMGEDPQPVLGETLASLTAAEQRVARLAATGLTNRQIADKLVVTVKAVEWHLSHVYRKLGIHARGALATALGPGI